MIEWTMRFHHSEYARCQEIRHQSEGGTRSVCGLKMGALQVLFARPGVTQLAGGWSSECIRVLSSLHMRSSGERFWSFEFVFPLPIE